MTEIKMENGRSMVEMLGVLAVAVFCRSVGWPGIDMPLIK